MHLLTRGGTFGLAAAGLVAAVALAAPSAQAASPGSVQPFTNVHGVSCTLHSETTGTYNSMFCQTSSSYHFTSTACRTSCTTVSSNTLANNRLVHICAPSGSGLSNTFTIYFGSTNEGTYSVGRTSIPPVPC